MKTINIARDFSRFPAGPLWGDGEFSGQRFRYEILLPALYNWIINDEPVTVEFGGTLGYADSWLAGAFGGLMGIFGSRLMLHRHLPDSLILDAEPWIVNSTIQYMREPYRYVTEVYGPSSTLRWECLKERQQYEKHMYDERMAELAQSEFPFQPYGR